MYPLRFLTTHPHQVRRPDLLVTRVGVLPPPRKGAVDVPAAFAASGALADLVELVAAGDLLVRLGRTTPADLRGAATFLEGRGAVAARRAAALVRERVDSPQETELRLCLTLAGLPEPECNPVVGRAGALARVDLRYREQRVALEYEGDQHRTDRWQWNRDLERHEQLLSDGWTVVLRDGGYRGGDPVFSPEWRDLYSPAARAVRLAHGLDVLRCAVDARNTPGEG